MPEKPSVPPPAVRAHPLGRWLLGAIVACYVGLAGNASLLMPLWEIPDEHSHLQAAMYWANEGSMPDRTNLPGHMLYPGLQEPLTYWVFAVGLKLLDLDEEEFLLRWRADMAGDIPEMFLHGRDEVFPFLGPVRRLHLLRLLSVLFGVVTVLGTHRLGRVLAPDRPAVALLAAGLVAVLPAFTVATAGITVDSLSFALATWSLIGLCVLATDPAPSRKRTGCLGLLIGATLLAKLTTMFLVALVPLALLLRRKPGERWGVTLVHFDWILAGVLMLIGPYLAWNLVTYGDIFALEWYRDYLGKSDDVVNISFWQAIRLHFLPSLGSSFVRRYAMLLDAGRHLLLAWSLVGVGGLLGWLVLIARRRVRWRSVVWLPIGAVTINFLMCLRVFADFYEIHGRYMYPSLAALAALVALGWLAWLWRPLALLAVVSLFALSVQSQLHELGPAYWPPWRAEDPHFMSWNPLTEIPETRRLQTIRLLGPENLSEHTAPPTLRWEGSADPDARYTVHVGTAGSPLRMRSYEDYGVAARDNYRIPAWVWKRVPPGVGMVCQVLRLPTLDAVISEPADERFVDVSPSITLRRMPSAGRR